MEAINQQNDMDDQHNKDNQWRDEMLQYLAEDIRETKQLVKAAEKTAAAAEETAKAAMRRADAAWELVVITKNQINRPWYRKLLGLS